MNNPELLNKKYMKILTRYNEMYFGLFMRDEKIYEILREEFDLEITTLYRIVLRMSKQAAQQSEPELA